MSKTYDVAVVGGGAVGLGLAGALSERGQDVVLLERGAVGREASYASGGMLSPYMELESYEPELLSFGRDSLGMYDSFCDTLERETGEDVGLRTEGTLYVARHQDQRSVVERLLDYQKRRGVEVRELDSNSLRQREPQLSQSVEMGLYSPREMRVNNRRLTLALLLRCRSRGVEIRSHEPVVDVEYGRANRITRCQTSEGTIDADQYINTAGAWSSALPGLRADDRVPVRPVKGQAVAIQLSDDVLPQYTIRTPGVYCVPHPPERLTIGATTEERGYDERVTAGAVLELLSEASDVLPGILEQPLLETWAGFRPASRDNLPVIGPSPGAENLWHATGHYRSGILLLPATIRYIIRYLETGDCPDPLEPFRPDRFCKRSNSSQSNGIEGSQRESTQC